MRRRPAHLGAVVLRPAGDYTTFTLFPWAGFVFAGAGCGVLLEQARDRRTERRVLIAICGRGRRIDGAWLRDRGAPVDLCAVVVLDELSDVFRDSGRHPDARPGARGRRTARRSMRVACHWPVLERLGRSSLFIYWIHVELVYGYATWPLRHRLPIWGAAIAFSLFAALMYGAIALRDRTVDWWRARRARHSTRLVPGNVKRCQSPGGGARIASARPSISATCGQRSSGYPARPDLWAFARLNVGSVR